MAFTFFSRGQMAPIWLADWARFGTLVIFERCLLLQYDLVLPNSSMHVATLCLGLWAYIEGMDGLYLIFTGANGSDLAGWARFGTLTLFEVCLPLLYILVLPNSSTQLHQCFHDP